MPGILAAAAIGVSAMLRRRNELSLHLLTVDDAGGIEAAPGEPSPAGTRVGGTQDGDHAAIDAVVPARDEAATVGGCAGALTASAGIATVTVVDDGSSDATAAAAHHAGATVVRIDGPPAGWLGKPHACHAGAGTGSAPWLAFVDADVRLEPWALAAIVRHCDAGGLAAASPLLRHRCRGLADRLIVPLAFWQYLVGLPGMPGPPRRHRAHPARAILNGQCLVVRRDVYTDVGGHAHPAVRSSVVDDSALARLLASRGHAVALLRGGEAGTVAMYDSLPAVRAGFGKNVAAFLAADPWRGLGVAAAGMALTSTPALLLAAARRRSGGGLLGALAAYTAGCAALGSAYRDAHQPAALALAHPLAAGAMQAIALESLARRALGIPWRWRGRPTTARDD